MYLSRRLAIQVPLWVTFLPSIPTASLSPYSNHFPDQDSGKLHGLCPVKNITKNEDLQGPGNDFYLGGGPTNMKNEILRILKIFTL